MPRAEEFKRFRVLVGSAISKVRAGALKRNAIHISNAPSCPWPREDTLFGMGGGIALHEPSILSRLRAIWEDLVREVSITARSLTHASIALTTLLRSIVDLLSFMKLSREVYVHYYLPLKLWRTDSSTQIFLIMQDDLPPEVESLARFSDGPGAGKQKPDQKGPARWWRHQGLKF